MATETIPLSQLEKNLRSTLNECADSGRPLVVELPDRRLLVIQGLDPSDDDLVGRLLESNEDFQKLLERSAKSPRKPFAPRSNQR